MKHPVTIFFTMLFLCHCTVAMDTLPAINEPSPATKAAIAAINDNQLLCLKQALADGANIRYLDPYGNTLLLLALDQRRLSILDYLIDYLITHPRSDNGTIINQQKFNGESILSHACFYGDKTLLEKLLLIPNVNVNIRDKYGNTLLHTATAREHIKIIALLLKQKALPTIQNDLGLTVAMYENFHISCANKSEQPLIKELVLSKDRNGNTQLHLLATVYADDITCEKVIHLFKAFVKIHGLNMWAKNKNNKLAVEVAYETYKKSLERYAKEKRHVDKLAQQEKIMHTFLIFYSSHIKNKPVSISSPCAPELNIESTIADKYKDNENNFYYYSFFECKEKLKQDLRNNPHNVPTLWVSETPPILRSAIQTSNDSQISLTTTGPRRVPVIATQDTNSAGRVPVIEFGVN
jgi:hypothetical protein